MAGEKQIVLAAQKKAKTNDPTRDDIFEVGTIGKIVQLLRLPDGTVKVLVEGKRRAESTEYADKDELLRGRGRGHRRAVDPTRTSSELMRTVRRPSRRTSS